MEASARRELKVLTPRQIYERLDAFVIGQEKAKRAVAIAAYNHLKRVQARKYSGPGKDASLVKKANILLVGPTGSGKTHIARNLAEILCVPFTTVDATEYTEAGYYGKDVEVMVAELLMRANHVVEDAQRGIIFIDEVDKIARRTQSMRNGAGSRDIGGEGVQQALLKLLEGREINVPVNPSQGFGRTDFVTVHTHDILFICAGTFSDLQPGLHQVESRAIGFAGERHEAPQKPLRVKDLVDFGMLNEFLGRLPILVQLQPLGEPELVRVLTEPPDAITREYRELLALDGIELKFTKPALREIARFSLEQGLGARGLRAVLEHVMSEVMFDAPERRYRSLTVDEEFVRGRLRAAQPEAMAL